MRSFQVVINQNASPQQFTMLRADARGAGNLLVHQKLGAIALSTNPTNGQTLTLDINGTNVVITFVSSIGSAAGNVLIGASAAATCASLVALLNQPQTTTSSGVALSAANQALVSYLSWPLSGTTVTPCSSNTSLYAPLTSFSASTTVTSGSYTAQTMQLYVEPGVVYVNGTRVKFAGGSTPTVTAPASNPRIDLLTIDNTGTLAFVTGTENASPAVPTYPADKVVLCEVYNVVGETGLFDFDNQQTGQGYIQSDVRPMLGLQFNPSAIPDSMLPSTDGSFDLGSASFEWNNIYAKTAIYLNGTPVGSQIDSQLLAAGQNLNQNDALYITQDTGSGLFDAASEGQNVTTGFTTSHTIGSGANRILLVFLAFGTGTPGSLAVTYGGTTMTQITSGTYNSGSGHYYLYGLLAPTSGSANISATWTGGATGQMVGWSGSGFVQSLTLDATHATTGSGTAISGSVTTVTAGAWAVALGSVTGGGSVTAGTNFTYRTGFGSNFVGDSGADINPAGSYSQSLTASGSSAWILLQCSVAPATVPAYKLFKASSASSGTNNFVGFSLTSYSAGATPLVINGGVVSGMSGLTPGAQYYLNDTAGTIGTSPGTTTRKVGIALDTTHLLITNIW